MLLAGYVLQGHVNGEELTHHGVNNGQKKSP